MQSLESAFTFTSPERPTIFGLRQSALVETLLLLAVMLFLDMVAFDHTRFWDVNPHPFWLIVLFISCKYGTKEGIVAALLCSAALLVGNMPEHTIAQDDYTYGFTVLRQPLLWLIAATAFGELRLMHVRERDNLETSLMESEKREQNIAQSYQRVRTLKDQMEVRMAGQLRSSVSAYQAARSMETLSPNEVLKGLEELVNVSLYPEQFSIYLLSNNRLEATLMHGWQEEDKHLKTFVSGSALYQSIIGKQETLCVINSDHERILGGQGIIAGPLHDKETGEVIGMLKIEKMNLADLNLSNIEAFNAICEWAAMAMVNANKYQSAKDGSIVNPDHNLFTHNYFKRYTDYMRSLAERLGFHISMIDVKLANPASFDDQTRTRIARALSDAVDGVLRKVDLAFDHQEKSDSYSIVLPTTNRQGAQVVVDKIRGALDKNLSKVSKNANFTFTVQTVYEKKS